MLQSSLESASNLRIVGKAVPSGRIVRSWDAPLPDGGTRSQVRSRSRPFLCPAAWAALMLTVQSAIAAAATSLKASPPGRRSARASCQVAPCFVGFAPPMGRGRTCLLLGAVAAAGLLLAPARAPSSADPLAFAPAQEYTATKAPESVAIGDVTGDRRKDVV